MDVFLHCYRVAHQEVFGGIEVTTVVDFLVLRLRGAQQEPRRENMTKLRKGMGAGRVPSRDLYGVLKDLISVWQLEQGIVRNTALRNIKTEAGRVSCFYG